MAEKIVKKKININKYNYDKTELGRIIQLTAFFHMLKLELGEDLYAEIANKADTFYIPYSFNIYETLALAKCIMPTVWYIEINKEVYVEFGRDEMVITGNKSFISQVSQAFDNGQRYTTDYAVFAYDFKAKGNDFAWNSFVSNEYERMVQIGDTFIKNGSLMVYPSEETEYYAYSKDDYYKSSEQGRDYVIMRSNYDPDRVIMLSLLNHVLLATGLDELEQEEIIDHLK